jgi:hypothetical protein
MIGSRRCNGLHGKIAKNNKICTDKIEWNSIMHAHKKPLDEEEQARWTQADGVN